jgi:glutaredoxin-like YruB-family protein
MLWTVSHAEVYRWTDGSGKIHFSDRKPAQHQSSTVNVRVNTYAGPGYDSAVLDTDKKVVMYSTGWCGYCKKAKRYFKANGIAYTEYDIEKDRRAKSEYDRLGGRGVPLIVVGQKRISGFSEAGFKAIYD